MNSHQTQLAASLMKCMNNLGHFHAFDETGGDGAQYRMNGVLTNHRGLHGVGLTHVMQGEANAVQPLADDIVCPEIGFWIKTIEEDPGFSLLSHRDDPGI